MRQFLLLLFFVLSALIISGNFNITQAACGPYCTPDGFSCGGDASCCCTGVCGGAGGTCGSPPIPPPAPFVTNVTVSPNPIYADGVTPHVIQITSQDNTSGGPSITTQYAFINYQYNDASYQPQANWRGYLGWSTENFPWWCGVQVCGSPMYTEPAVPVGCAALGSAARNYLYTIQYLIVDSCSTSVQGGGLTRVTNINVRFTTLFQGPVSGNVLSGWTQGWYGAWGWWPFQNFNAFVSPIVQSTTISANPVVPNGITSYYITMVGTDENGGSTIAEQRTFINAIGPNAGLYRGVLGWSKTGTFPGWGGAYKAGSFRNCFNGAAIEGIAGIYAGFGPNYTTITECITSYVGSTRTTRLTVVIDTSFGLDGPQTNNNLAGYIIDDNGLTNNGQWIEGMYFDLLRPNLSASNVMLRINMGGVYNCAAGTQVASGQNIPNGTLMEICAVVGNAADTGTTFLFDNYINQPTQPPYGTVGFQTYTFGPWGTFSPALIQLGTVVASNAICTTNCRAAVFFDRNNTLVESNETDNFAISVPYNVVIPRQVSGGIVVDLDGSNCVVDPGVYAGGGTVNIRNNGGTIIGSGSVSGGNYSVTTIAGSNYTADIAGFPANYTLKAVAYDGNGFSTTGVSGFSWDPAAPDIDLSAGDKSVSFCLDSTKAWLSLGNGDVRFPSFSNPIPSGQCPVLTAPLPAFFSSNTSAGFGACAAQGFTVNNEYSYNDDSRNRQGLFSYTFFRNRAKVKGVPVPLLSGCAADSACTRTLAQLSNLPTGIYLVDGDLTVTAGGTYVHQVGSHVLFLVKGNINFNLPADSNISVPAGIISGGASGSLLIFAAKGNINIASTYGKNSPITPGACASQNPLRAGDYTCANFEGILSAEGNVQLASNASCPSTPDKQFVMAGNLIANSLKPFTTGGSGKFIFNNRTLCDQDTTIPAFMIRSRFDFALQLTDFYKIPSIRWKELNP